MPCSNCSFVAFPPTFAKWPLTVITDGAVGCLLLTGGRFSFPLGFNEVGCDDMVEGLVQVALQMFGRDRAMEEAGAFMKVKGETTSSVLTSDATEA